MHVENILLGLKRVNFIKDEMSTVMKAASVLHVFSFHGKIS